jgi:hypothetical protein
MTLLGVRRKAVRCANIAREHKLSLDKVHCLEHYKQQVQTLHILTAFENKQARNYISLLHDITSGTGRSSLG